MELRIEIDIVFNVRILSSQEYRFPCFQQVLGCLGMGLNSESWPFLCHHSLQPNFLQAILNCLHRDKLVDNIPKSCGDLDCIFSPA